MDAWIVLIVFAAVFFLVLHRKFPIQVVALCGAGILLASGIVPWRTAVSESIQWEVLGIYFGYGILSVLLEKSRLPRAVADAVIPRMRSERSMLLFLSALSALLSSFMPNPVVVLMIAPLALDVADRLKRSPFVYLVSIAIASNVVTTVTMVADPPALILAMKTQMSFLDFYWLDGRPGLGTLTVPAVLVALGSLWFMFRTLRTPLHIDVEQYRAPRFSRILFAAGILSAVLVFFLAPLMDRRLILVLLAAVSAAILTLEHLFGTPAGSDAEPAFLLGPAAVFVLSVAALILAPAEPPAFAGSIMGYHGWIGLVLGLVCLLTLGKDAGPTIRKYDWETTLFLAGIFIVIDSVDRVGILSGFVQWMMGAGFTNPFLVFTFITWISVILSAFIDNVPYTVLMIPVCGHFSETLGISPYYLYFGMLIGTGIGGNITPVGATANVLACGMLEKRGIKIDTRAFMKLSVPFSVSAVLAGQILIHLFWAG